MKKSLYQICIIITVVCLANWGDQETSAEGRKKQSVNFSGSLVTQDGERIAVDNIAIGRRFDQIPVFKKPATANEIPEDQSISAVPVNPDNPPANPNAMANTPANPKKNKTTRKKTKNTAEEEEEIMLQQDPKDGIIVKIDLAEIKEIKVPSSTLFSFKKRKSSKKTHYIEIVVISNDDAHTQNSYLIDTRRKLTCDQINAAGPIEMEAPINTIRSLTIDGYKYRPTKKEDKNKNPKNNNKVKE